MWARRATAGVLGLFLLTASAAASPEWAHEPGRDRGASRPSLIPYDTVDHARERARSPWARSLSGAWRFQWTTEGAESDSFHLPEFDVEAWSELVVPSNWESAGFGSLEPGAPRGVGSYRRSFRIDPTWAEREVFLRFEGVGPAAIVWVNGERVGRVQGSKSAVEFTLTRRVREGENTLAVQVFGMGEGESGWLSGISRDVTLYATERCRVEDVEARALFEPDSLIGRARVVVTLMNRTDEVTENLIEASLFRGDTVYPFESASVRCEPNAPALHVFELDVPDAAPWSAESPALYDLILKHGSDVISIPVGFRRFEVQEGRLLVNGVPVRLRGVRRREVHPDFGHAVPADVLARDVELMKAANVNAVWSDGFPPDPRWLDLCDRAGLYVVDEVNARELMGGVGEVDSLRSIVVADRLRSMVARDHHHPSVIGWSLDVDADSSMVTWLRERADPRFTLHRADLGANLRSDLRVTTAWPTLDDVIHEGTSDRERAVLYGELVHVSGNSLGGLAEGWRTLAQYPNLAGGFVSLWNDAGVGADVDARGLVTGRRERRPAWYEVRKVFQPLSFELGDAEEGRYALVNGYHSRDVDGYRVAWDVLADGAPVLRDTLSVTPTEPGDRFEFVVVTDGIEPEPGREYVLTLSALEPAGTREVAWGQFKLPIFRSPAPVEAASAGLHATSDADSVTVIGSGFATSFLRSRGEWMSYRSGGRELIVRGPTPHFWREPTPIDVASGFHESSAIWRSVSEVLSFTDFEILAEEENEVRLRTRYGFGELGGSVTFTYTVFANGDVDVEYEVDLDAALPPPARVGFRMWLPDAFGRVEWFGTGPHETYPDRQASGRLSRHVRALDEPTPGYGDAQEAGGREGIRWMVAGDTDGAGWLVVGESMFATSIETAPSPTGVEGERAVEWSIDAARRGVGGNAVEARGPDSDYTLTKRQYSMRVRFRPHDPTYDPAARARATRAR